MKGNENVSFWPLMSVIFIGAFLAVFNLSAINIAIPVLMKSFSTNLDAVKWTLTAYILSLGIIAPITGYLGEKISYKRLYILALIGFTLSSFLCATSQNIHLLIFSRILQGCFGGVIAPSAMAIIYQIIHKNKQAFAISIWALASMLGPALGPTIAGWLIENYGWKSIFIVNVPIGIVATIMSVFIMPYYKLSSTKTFDSIGFATCIGASVSLLVAFSQGANWGLKSFKFLLLVLAGVLCLALFIHRELTTKEPMLNLRVFRYKRFTLSIVLIGIIYIALYSGVLFAPLFLQNVQGLSPIDAGLVMLPPSLVMAVSMPLVGKLYEKMEPQLLIIIGIMLIAFGSWKMGHLVVDTSKWYVTCWMIVRNIGISMSMMPVTNLGMAAVHKELSGHASAANNWIRQSVGSLSVGIFASLLSTRTVVHVQKLEAVGLSGNILYLKASTLGINEMSIIATIIVLIGIPITLGLRKRSSVYMLTQYEDSI